MCCSFFNVFVLNLLSLYQNREEFAQNIDNSVFETFSSILREPKLGDNLVFHLVGATVPYTCSLTFPSLQSKPNHPPSSLELYQLQHESLLPCEAIMFKQWWININFDDN